MNTVQSNLTSDQIMNLHQLMFETLGFKMIKINTDSDCFSLQLVRNIDVQNNTGIPRLETLLVASLELFNHLLLDSDEPYRSSFYFLNLHPKPILSSKFLVEIDYIKTTSDVVYLEAYCYEDNELLVAKGGTSIIKGL